jgi:hypothetical protein
MINKIIRNRLYIGSSFLLCVLTYLLNYCKSISECALVFTIIAITVNVITYIWGKANSLQAVALAITVSFALLMKLPYYIEGHLVNGLVFASLSSLMVSLYCSTLAFQRFHSKFSFVLSNALSLIIAGIIDGILMDLFFAFNNNFGYARILDILVKELSYKAFYGFISSATIFAAFKILNNRNITNNNLKINSKP